MDTPLTVTFFDHQREYHRITFPPPITGALFPHVKKQICDVIGVKDQELFWSEMEDDMEESEDDDDLFAPLPPIKQDPPLKPFNGPEDLDAVIQNLRTVKTRNGEVPNLELCLSAHPPPILACRVNSVRTSKKPGEPHLRFSERKEKVRWLEHGGITCDGCEKSAFGGLRYKCIRCYNFDLCYQCYMEDSFGGHEEHSREHPMKCIDFYFNDDSMTTHSTCTITVLACLYCEEKGLSPLDYYEHLKQAHQPLNGPNTFAENRDAHISNMINDLFAAQMERMGEIERKEREFVQRERDLAAKDFRGSEARQLQLDAVIEEKRRQVTALDAKMKEVEARERAVKEKEKELDERERAVEEVERLPRKMRRMRVTEQSSDEIPVVDGTVGQASSDSDESYEIIDRNEKESP